jgi:multidrug resistance efflux pump
MKRQFGMMLLVVGPAAAAVVGLVLVWPQAPLDAALTAPDSPSALLVCSGSVDTRQGPLLLLPARAGRVVRVFAKEKQTVRKDTPLLQLDDGQVKVQEEEASFAVQAAELQLAKAKDGLKQYQAKQAQGEAAVRAAGAKSVAAQHALAIEERYFETGYSNKDRVGAARAQLDAANALAEVEQDRLAELKAVDPEREVRLARLQLDRSRAQLEQARDERAEYRLLAPADGLVVRVEAQDGELIGPTSSRPAGWLMPAGALIVRAEVSQEFAGRLREGLAALVEDEESGRLLAKGRVAQVSDWFLPRRQISLLPTNVNTGLTLECIIDVQEELSQLRFGQRTRVRILADQSPGTPGGEASAEPGRAAARVHAPHRRSMAPQEQGADSGAAGIRQPPAGASRSASDGPQVPGS